MAVVYGIDLGTTFCSIASMGVEDEAPALLDIENNSAPSKQLASELFVEESGGTPARAYFGDAAIERSITSTGGLHMVHPKRLIGYPTENLPIWRCGTAEFDPVDASALLLRKLEAVIRSTDPSQTIEVVVTHPRDYKLPKKKAVEDAVALTGMHLLQTIDEPVAAALAFFTPDAAEPAGKYLVFDLGGGTLDIAVVSVTEGKQPSIIDGYGDQELGGKDWDDALYALILQSAQEAHPEFPYEQSVSALTRRRLRQLATQWKLTFQRRVEQKKGFNSVMHTGSELSTPLAVKRADWDAACEPLVARCSRAIDAALKSARLSEDDITQVLPVGGSVRLLSIQTLLHERFKHRVAPIDGPGQVRPDYAVAEGAARYARMLKHTATSAATPQTPSVLRTAEAAIQTALANAVNVLVADQRLAVVVPQGAPLPASQTRHFVVEDVGAQLTIAFYEGTREFVPPGEPPSATLAFQPHLAVRPGDGVLITVDIGPSGRIAARVTHEPSGAMIESELRVGHAHAGGGAAGSELAVRRQKLSSIAIL